MPDLRLRVYDTTEEELPDRVASVEIGDDLRAVVTWGTCIVPVELSRSWGVSMDELVATALHHVAELPFKRHTLERDDAAVEATLGHPWASSLVMRLDEEPKGSEGAVLAVPRGDLMLSAPVVGAATVDSLELIMLLCDELYDASNGGISPHVWWSWHDGLYTTVRGFGSEVEISADDHNGLRADSSAQCQHIRSASVDRIEVVRGNVGPTTLSEIRGVLALMMDIA